MSWIFFGYSMGRRSTRPCSTVVGYADVPRTKISKPKSHFPWMKFFVASGQFSLHLEATVFLSCKRMNSSSLFLSHLPLLDRSQWLSSAISQQLYVPRLFLCVHYYSRNRHSWVPFVPPCFCNNCTVPSWKFCISLIIRCTHFSVQNHLWRAWVTSNLERMPERAGLPFCLSCLLNNLWEKIDTQYVQVVKQWCT